MEVHQGEKSLISDCHMWQWMHSVCQSWHAKFWKCLQTTFSLHGFKAFMIMPGKTPPRKCVGVAVNSCQHKVERRGMKDSCMDNTVRCHYNRLNLKKKFSQQTPHSSPMWVRHGWWGVFCEFKLWFMFRLHHCSGICSIISYWTWVPSQYKDHLSQVWGFPC